MQSLKAVYLTGEGWMPCLVLYSLMIVPLTRVDAFNVGTSGANIIRGKPGSHFGSTLHFLPETSKFKEPNKMALLVSAPKQKTTEGGSRTVMGVVSTCTDIFSSSPVCTNSRQMADRAYSSSSADEQFGFSVAVNADGAHIICSPQWLDTAAEAANFYFKPGRCSVVYSPTVGDKPNGTEYTPYWASKHEWATKYIIQVPRLDNKAKSRTVYYEATALYGLSVDSKKDHYFVAGAPGVLEGEGTVAVTDWTTGKTVKLNVPQVNNIETKAYGYLGYDVAIGKFCDGSVKCFAASAPNLNRIGMVKIFKMSESDRARDSFTIVQHINGQKAWSYFGYSIAACDVNNDGWDELLVGAPHETIADDAEGHDQGRVYIYGRTDADQKFSRSQVVLGGSRKKFSRFGAKVQCIGDINLDGYMDVAVGAPNEDEGAGGLYIYLGSALGLSTPASQRIPPSLLPSALKGLGYAISESHVVPGSNYPVLAVSSIMDDAVVVLNTRPIVDASVKIETTPAVVDITQPCSRDDIQGACFTVELCLTGTIRGGGTWDNMFTTKLTIDINVNTKGLKRALFLLNDGKTEDSIEATVNSGQDPCISYTAVVIEAQANRNRFNPVDIEAHFSLASTAEDDKSPVLDKVKPQSIKTTVTFKNDCGDNNICDIDLSITGALGYSGYDDLEGIAVNGTKELLVDLDVKNSEETNYWTVVEISVNSPLLFSRPTPSSDPSVVCQSASQDSEEATTTAMDKVKVECNYYKPLKRDQTIHVGVAFDTFEIPLDKKALTVTAKVLPKNTQTSNEKVPANNAIELATNVRIIADVTVNGVSSPTEVTIQDAKKISVIKKVDITEYTVPSDVEKLNVTHKFLVRNEGPSNLLSTKVLVTVPFYLTDASRFVNSYDVQIAHAEGDVSVCKETKNFDRVGGVIENPTTAATTPENLDTTKASGGGDAGDGEQETTVAPITTTEDFGGLPPVDPNRRRRRSTLSRRRRSAYEFTGAVNSNIYVQSCALDPIYCQEFECDLSKGLKRDQHAEVIVTLKVDKNNIPIPEGLNTFWYEIRAKVKEPRHDLMQEWEKMDGVGSSVTKFHLVEPAGKINIWIIIGSVIGGLILITIVVLILWKAGFFKRNKHHQVAQWKRESQRKSRYSSVPTSEGPEKGGK